MNSRFDSFIDSVNEYLYEYNEVEADNAKNLATNIDPNIVKSFKADVLMPMANKQNVDPAKLQNAIKAGVIEDHGDNIYTVTDAALSHANQDPDLQGKFLPSQQAAAEIQRQRQSQPTQTSSQTQPANNTQPTQSQPVQNPTTSKTTSKPSTNQAGVVSSVYKMQ